MADGGADARCAAGTDGVSLVLPAFSNRSVASGSAQARSRVPARLSLKYSSVFRPPRSVSASIHCRCAAATSARQQASVVSVVLFSSVNSGPSRHEPPPTRT